MAEEPSKTNWCPRENLEEKKVLGSFWTTSPSSERPVPSMADLLSVVKQSGFSDHKYLLRPLRKALRGNVLDVEIKSTALALEAARLPKVSRVTAVILNREEASKGKRLAESEGLSGKIEFWTGDLLDIDLQDKYDWVVFNPPDFTPSLKILGPFYSHIELSMPAYLMTPVFLGKLDDYMRAFLTKATQLLKPEGRIFLKLLTYPFATADKGLGRRELEEAFEVEVLLEASTGASALYALSLDPRGTKHRDSR